MSESWLDSVFPDEIHGFELVSVRPDLQQVVYKRDHTQFVYTGTADDGEKTMVNTLPIPFANTPTTAIQVFTRFADETEFHRGDDPEQRQVQMTLRHRDGWEYTLNRRYGELYRNGERILTIRNVSTEKSKPEELAHLASEHILEEMGYDY